MQKASTNFFVLHMLNSFSQRYVQTTPGSIVQTSLAGLPGGETKVWALIESDETAAGDHDPWD